MTRNYAASRMHEALRIAAIRDPKGGPGVESAISLGYIGLGMIIFGAALFWAGLVVMARRMSTTGCVPSARHGAGTLDVTVPRAALRCLAQIGSAPSAPARRSHPIQRGSPDITRIVAAAATRLTQLRAQR
jgi:hypothetical protein